MSTSWNKPRLHAVSSPSPDSGDVSPETLARLARNELDADERARVLERVAEDPVLAQALRVSRELEPWSRAVADDIETALAERRSPAAGARQWHANWRPALALAASVMVVAVTFGIWFLPGSIPGSMDGHRPSPPVANRSDAATPAVASRAARPDALFRGDFETESAPKTLFQADFEKTERSRVFRGGFERDTG